MGLLGTGLFNQENQCVFLYREEMKRRGVDDPTVAWTTLEENEVTKESTRLVELGTSGQSWALAFKLPMAVRPDEEDQEALYQLRPAELGEIKIMGKLIKTPRYQQAYGRPYTFSGVAHPALSIPPVLQRFVDFANRACEPMLMRDYAGRQFNMILANWYTDGNHYIGWHSDDEKELYLNQRGETLVFSISFGQQRRFLLKEKQKKGEKTKVKAVTLELSDSSCIVMGGRCQREFKHSVPKEPSKAMGKRLNLTLRIFK